MSDRRHYDKSGVCGAYDPSNVTQLLDALINHWGLWDQHEQFYLTTLAPFLVKNPTQGDETEREILQKLRILLNQNEWMALPILISERRPRLVREIESEREKQERARQEAQRHEAERQERIRQEILRREAEAREKQEKARQEAQRHEAERQERRRQEILRREAEARRAELIRMIRKQFDVDFLGADSFFVASCSDKISHDEYEQEKVAFVKNWVTEHTPPDKDGKKRSPDDEQAAAIAAVHGHIQVVARAGSGKTTTLVGRALFLQKHCGIRASEMLVLAFNRKATFEGDVPEAVDLTRGRSGGSIRCPPKGR